MAAFAALQPMLNLIGLMLDFIGVALLAWEWRIALRAEERERELEAREARVEPPPSMPRPSGPHQDTFDWMDRRRKASQKARRAEGAFAARRGWFFAAFALIAVGFLLQIIAAIPL